MAKSRKSPKKCTVKTIKFKTRNGPITFRAHRGTNCPKRRKPSTAHLNPWKDVMRDCAKEARRKGGGIKAIRRCVASTVVN